LELDAALFIKRVPTKENLADDPSRERYKLLSSMGAVAVPPVLDKRFSNAQSWESLGVTAHKAWLAHKEVASVVLE